MTQTEKLTNTVPLKIILQEIIEIFDKHQLQEGDAITIIAHLNHLIISRITRRQITQCQLGEKY